MFKDEKSMTQNEQFKERLKAIKLDVTTQDRILAVERFGTTPATISRYLNGKVLNNDKASILLQFFQERIEQRNKILQNA